MDFIKFLIFAAVVAVVIYFIRKNDKKESAAAGVVLDQGLPFPCVIEGTVDGSPMADRIKALEIEANTKLITLTGDYAVDYKAQGGEMHLTGDGFKFTIGSDGQIVQGQSHVNIFAEDYPCEGGMNPDGSLGISVVVTDKVTGDVAKLGVSGSVANGKLVNGKLSKGQLPHIYSVLSGTHIPTVK